MKVVCENEFSIKYTIKVTLYIQIASLTSIMDVSNTNNRFKANIRWD